MTTTRHEVDHQQGRRRPRFLRFSLRTFLVLVVLLTLLCAWLGIQVQRVGRQKRVVAAVLDLGGRVRYDWQPSLFEEDERRVQAESAAQTGRARPTFLDEPGGPEWLRNWVGHEYFQHIAEIQLVGTNVYTDRVAISDEVLDQVTSLHDLEGLILTTTDVSDADLQQIGRLTKLRYLLITNARITDAGLVHLRSLHGLEQLSIRETEVTEEGVQRLKEYLPDCTIGFRASSF